MGIIIPAILPKSKEDLEQKLALIEGLATEIQIDVVDGNYASPSTWPYINGKNEIQELSTSGEMLPRLGRFHYEADLMVMNPEQVLGYWIDAGANRITIHAESTRYLGDLITKLGAKYGHEKDFALGLLSLGLAVGINTDPGLIEPYLDKVDYVQFMGIAHIGRQGEPFDPRVLQRISSFKKRHPNMQTQVDGGIALAHVRELLELGVDRLIVGSDLWKADSIKEEFKKLQTMAEQYNG